MNKTENQKAIKAFQEKIKLGKSFVSSKEIQELNIDTSAKIQEFRNILLKKDWAGDWSVSVKNDLADLDGTLFSENKKLLSILKTKWENNTPEIKFQELINLNIWTPSTEFTIGNFLLSKAFGSSMYRLSLANKLKNMDGLWTDKAISTDRVLETLHSFQLSATDLSGMSEVQLNKLLETHFKKFFEVVKRGGSSNQGLIDIILGTNHNYGIEIKLGRETIKSSQSDRARGQVERYITQFGQNFMVVIAGSLEEKGDKNTQSLIKKIKDSKGMFFYLETQ